MFSDQRGARATPLVPAVATTEVPPPPPSDPLNDWQKLPPGWTTAYSPKDGRIYYWEKSTGKTSWTHPLATPSPPMDFAPDTAQMGQNNSRGFFNRPWNMFSNRAEFHDTPWTATRRPNNHQCYAMAALVLCFPVGVCAVFQSIMVDRAWSDGQYGDAVNHSRQASQYACFGSFIGVIFWIWFFFFEELVRMTEWFRFD